MAIGFDETIEWYNRNASLYSTKDTIYPEDLKQFQRFIDSISPKGRVLDAGCGGGLFSSKLQEEGFEVIGLDISKELIKIAEKKYPKVTFLLGDLRKLPFIDGYFSGIFAHASLVHLETESDVIKILNEFHRVLKSNGVLHMNVKKQIGENETEQVIEKKSQEVRFFRFYKEDELLQLLSKSGFKIISSESYDEFERNGVGRKDTYWINIFAQKI